MQLHAEVEDLAERCVELRRDLHRIPETCYTEFKTQGYIINELEKLEPDVLQSIAGTGVKAVYYAENAQETIAFRADMDGLHITEDGTGGSTSANKDFMHACGHDGHMAVLLLLADLVSRHKGELKQNVVLLFQPAEEGGGGAKKMIRGGALQNPKVDKIYGLHVWPEVEGGKIGVRWGPMMAQTLEFDIIVKGVSAHGASPQMGVDAVVVAAELITMLQTMITRSVDPHQDALLTIGKIDGGVARNIIADKVTLNATLRMFDKAVYDTLIERIGALTSGLAMAMGANFEMYNLMSYPCVDNPREMVEELYSFVDMSDTVLVDPVMAAEDFACYQEQIPGLFFQLGIKDAACEHPLHSSRFNFDEKNLLFGIEIYRRILGICQ